MESERKEEEGWVGEGQVSPLDTALSTFGELDCGESVDAVVSHFPNYGPVEGLSTDAGGRERLLDDGDIVEGMGGQELNHDNFEEVAGLGVNQGDLKEVGGVEVNQDDLEEVGGMIVTGDVAVNGISEVLAKCRPDLTDEGGGRFVGKKADRSDPVGSGRRRGHKDSNSCPQHRVGAGGKRVLNSSAKGSGDESSEDIDSGSCGSSTVTSSRSAETRVTTRTQLRVSRSVALTRGKRTGEVEDNVGVQTGPGIVSKGCKKPDVRRGRRGEAARRGKIGEVVKEGEKVTRRGTRGEVVKKENERLPIKRERGGRGKGAVKLDRIGNNRALSETVEELSVVKIEGEESDDGADENWELEGNGREETGDIPDAKPRGVKRARKLVEAKCVRCEHCGEEFPSQKAYFDHRKAEESWQTCTVCGKVEPFMAHLIVHMQKHNPVKVDHLSDDGEEEKEKTSNVGGGGMLAHTGPSGDSCVPTERVDEASEGVGGVMETQNSVATRKMVGLPQSESADHKTTISVKGERDGKNDGGHKKAEKRKGKESKKKKKERMKCEMCGEVVSSMDSLKIHTMLHTGELAYRCCVCPEKFPCLSARQHHMNSHLTALRFRCTSCDLRFLTRADLAKHQLSHQIQCGVCGEVFPNRTSRNCHYRTAHPDRILRCDQCTAQFGSAEELKRHLAYHRKDKREQCPTCGLVVCKLKEHMLVHAAAKGEQQERLFACDQCPQRYLRRTNLDRHMLTHSGERPYACDRCPKRFRSNGMLRRHLLTHTREKPFQCEVCGKRCAIRSNLSIHMRVHASHRRYACPHCSHTFNHKNSLQGHIKAKHSQPEEEEDGEEGRVVAMSDSFSSSHANSHVLMADSLTSSGLVLTQDHPPASHHQAGGPPLPPPQPPASHHSGHNPPLPPQQQQHPVYSTLQPTPPLHLSSSMTFAPELRKALDTPLTSTYALSLSSRLAQDVMTPDQRQSDIGLAMPSSFQSLTSLQLSDKVEMPGVSGGYVAGLMDKPGGGAGRGGDPSDMSGGVQISLAPGQASLAQGLTPDQVSLSSSLAPGQVGLQSSLMPGQVSLASGLTPGMLIDTDKIFLTKFDMNQHSMDPGY
ncbi:zinc finger protein 628-like [Aplysia californica]|uniref:Zinc finger protein 628-like n=1 Tax=Aplysia californica TaxID=6500 RepID=A0ABM1W5A1_APLCA|nr:zinc finger protein 628-like [Aplysia californica]